MKQLSRKPSETARARMEALAKLPVFFDLAGKSTVVAGGSDAAAWKAELLAAAGADVAIFASDVHEEMAELLRRGASSGSLAWTERAVLASDLRGAAMFVADASGEDEAAHLAEMAKQAGVPFNAIDRTAYCDFQFGSIVNRSPVVIGISTDGAAPVLGQVIRGRIEAMLPPALADWGALARSLRSKVARDLAPGPKRRRFWERFSTLAFTKPLNAETAAAANDTANIHAPAEGRVTMVGAGPGDAEHLTLKALRALQSADVILFDDLVSDEVLELARREAKRMLVGKRGHRESCRQEDINDLMVKLAYQGKHVVRLKSGDPMIFGRGGEEIVRLKQECIPFAVVPGITAASAMASSLGVSLTHRDHAQSVRFVTGHSRQGRLPDNLDWKGLADPRTTTIVYMGGKTAAEMAGKLIDAGMPADTPVAVASNAGRASEAVAIGEVQFLPLLVNQMATTGPVLIGIGQAFSKQAADFNALSIDFDAHQMQQKKIAG